MRGAVDRLHVVAGTFLLGSLAALVAFTLPILLGRIADAFGYSEARLGTVAAIYFGIFTVASLASVLWCRRVSWRWAGLAGASLFGAGFVLAGLTATPSGLTAGLAVAGIGGGSLLALSYTITSDMHDVDSKFGWKLLVEQAYPAALLLLFSITVADRWGFRETFVAVGLAIGATGLWAFALPHGHPPRSVDAEHPASGARGTVFLGLLGVLLFFFGYMAVWAFIERFGRAHGIGARTIGLLMTASILLYGVGGLAAALLGDRVGRVRPQIVAALLIIVGLGLLTGRVEPWHYAVAVCVIPTANAFGLAYQMGLVSSADVTGGFTALIAAAVAIGATLAGPVAGTLIERSGYTTMFALVGVLTVCAVGLFGFVAARLRA